MKAARSQTAVRVPILVIEDEPSVTAFVRAALERSGYEVVPAASGAEGLHLLAMGNFFGVISDIRTPGGINGADVLDWLRNHRPELCARIIFITGDTANQETAALLEHSGAPCVEKPFRVQPFISVVEKTFGKP